MTPSETLQRKTASVQPKGQTSQKPAQAGVSQLSQGSPGKSGLFGQSFRENLDMVLLIAFATVLTVLFVKFMEHEIAEVIHFPDRPVQIDPAGY